MFARSNDVVVSAAADYAAHPETMNHEEELRRLVRGSAALMQALHAVRSLSVPSAMIGAGAVRDLVWSTLHERPFIPSDVDVVYFDDADLTANRETTFLATLSQLDGSLHWEVVNQARVHQWFEGRYGEPCAPLRSVEEGIASWPETATAVAVRLTGAGELQVVAPFGLHDLFSLVLRANPRRGSLQQFAQRLTQKRFPERFPRLRVVTALEGEVHSQ